MMQIYRAVFLWCLVWCIFIVHANAQTIPDGYIGKPNTCVFTTPNDYGVVSNNRLVQSSFVGGVNSIVQIKVGPSYRYDGASLPLLNFTQGQVFVPDKFTVSYPYCTAAAPQIISAQTTAGCEGTLFYGYNSITEVTNIGVPVDPTINGNAGVLIEGQFVPSSDQLTNFRGTFTWIRPNATCPSVNAAFSYTMQISNLVDVADGGITAYTDSASGLTKYCTTFGLACSTLPRQTTNNPNLQPYDPRPVLVPVCRQVLPFNSSYSVSSYETFFGAGFRAPTNVAAGAIVYQLRADNLPSPLAIYTEIEFRYVTGSVENTTVSTGPLETRFDPVLFIASAGPYPARVFAKFYNPSRTFQLILNEVDYGYLAPCNCNGNLVCDSGTFEMLGNATRAQIPNYNAAVVYTDAPTCVFYVNAANNGTSPIANVDFNVQSGSTGGVGTIFYAWQFVNLPASAGIITSPLTAASITARVFAPSTVTLRLRVYNANNVSRTCDQTFTVIAGAPTAVVAPTSITTATNMFVVLDGSASFSPYTPIVSYQWNITFPGPSASTALSTPTGPVTSFISTVPGNFIITLKVQSLVSSNSANSIISVVTPPPAPSNSTTPVAPPIAPGCVEAPLANINFTFAPQMPIGGAPVQPLPPGTVNPPPVATAPVQAPTTVIEEIGTIIDSALVVVGAAVVGIFGLWIISGVYTKLQISARQQVLVDKRI
jgi:hypothetical protein